MLSTSFEFRRKTAESSDVLFRAKLTLADGTVRWLVGDDVMMGGVSFSEATSSGSSFDVGAAIMGKFQLTLNNHDRRFDEYDFAYSTVEPYIGVELDEVDEQTGEHLVEWLAKGIYGIDQPKAYGGTISLTALDNMRFFEKPYKDITTHYPASLGAIVSDICDECDVTLKTASFANFDYIVQERPTDDALNCLDVIGYAAQASGNYAKVGADGRLSIDWYDTDALEGEDWLDGETFDDGDPYQSGDTADGGNFTNYGSGDSYDGGSFEGGKSVYIHAYSDATVITDDVVITGISVTAQDEVTEDGAKGEDGETAHWPASDWDGYAIRIVDNPLVQYGQAETVARQIAARVVGMRFRPFDVSALGNPAAEAGDPIIFVDRLQNQYLSYITSLVYSVGAYGAYTCSAETPGRNTATTYSALTKSIVEMRTAVQEEATARELALAELSHELENSSGLYMTAVPQHDGSTIRYMHDKPTLAESSIVWKMTAEALGISTDGGTTYPYGIDVSGSAILQRISAVEINTEFILAGQRVIIGKVASGQYNTVISQNAMTVRKYTTDMFSITTTDSTLDDGTVEVYNSIVMGDTRFSVRTERVTRIYNPSGVALVAYKGVGQYREYNGRASIYLGTVDYITPVTSANNNRSSGDVPLVWVGECDGYWYATLKASASAYLQFEKTSKATYDATCTLLAPKIRIKSADLVFEGGFKVETDYNNVYVGSTTLQVGGYLDVAKSATFNDSVHVKGGFYVRNAADTAWGGCPTWSGNPTYISVKGGLVTSIY